MEAEFCLKLNHLGQNDFNSHVCAFMRGRGSSPYPTP